MIVSLLFPATLSDLMSVEGKSELIRGVIVVYPPMGRLPAELQMEILVALHEYAESTGIGEAFGRSLGYALLSPLRSGRESFCADASYHSGPWPENPMSFIPAAPTFAVEIKGSEDYTTQKQVERSDKRADYFEAGTLAVWDVDPLAQTITLYTPNTEIVFRPGDLAHAEPALPGWTLDVSTLFE